MRKLHAILAALVLALALLPVAAYAESFTSEKDWTVTFTSSKQMTTNYTAQGFADELSQLEPGDDITLKVALKNEYKEATDWYVANEIEKAFEDSGATGGAYTYKLTYAGPDGSSRTLYDSTSVGGDDNQGLNDVDSALAEHTYLGSIASGRSGMVTLYIKLDGETQGNNYKQTIADLKLSFAAEIPEGKTVNKTVTNTVRQTVPTTGSTSAVSTGDTTQLLPLFVALGVSGLVRLALAVDNVRRSRAEGKEDLR